MIRTWQPAPADPLLERLRFAHWAQDPAVLSYGDCGAANEEVGKAQTKVDRIRNDIWRRTWGWLGVSVRL